MLHLSSALRLAAVAVVGLGACVAAGGVAHATTSSTPPGTVDYTQGGKGNVHHVYAIGGPSDIADAYPFQAGTNGLLEGATVNVTLVSGTDPLTVTVLTSNDGAPGTALTSGTIPASSALPGHLEQLPVTFTTPVPQMSGEDLFLELSSPSTSQWSWGQFHGPLELASTSSNGGSFTSTYQKGTTFSTYVMLVSAP